MKTPGLTAPFPLATSRPMVVTGKVAAGAAIVLGVMALSGCISVSAPDKPIVIELNINVKQEVVYRLAADANKTIEDNKQIF